MQRSLRRAAVVLRRAGFADVVAAFGCIAAGFDDNVPQVCLFSVAMIQNGSCELVVVDGHFNERMPLLFYTAAGAPDQRSRHCLLPWVCTSFAILKASNMQRTQPLVGNRP